jgi:Lon protease-like protein
MVRVNPLPDGRFNILLQGLREFSVIEESITNSYREARVEWRPPLHESLVDGVRMTLRRLLERYLRNNEKVQQFLTDQSIEDEFLVNFFAFHLDFLPIEKQGLLEAATLTERAERLCDMLDFKLSEAQWPEAGGGSGKPKVH